MINTRVAIDFDGTIIPYGPLTEKSAPFKGVARAISELKKQGFTIVIYTSRLSKHWWEEAYRDFGATDPDTFGNAQAKYVEDFLKFWSIPYDILTAEKIPCCITWDDTAIRIDHHFPLTDAIYAFLESRK